MDAFLSYAHEDADWVRVLARNLHESGLDVFFDEWDVVGGSRLSERLQEGLATSRAVALVVSAAAAGKPWWQEEFAAAVALAVAGKLRLVPVLVDDVELPPFVASRVWVDFRHVDTSDDYLAALDRLVRAIRAVAPSERPVRGGGIVVPPGAYKAEGVRTARLRIRADEVVFSTGGVDVEHAPLGVDAALRSRLTDLDRARSTGAPVLRGRGGVLHTALLETGRALGARFADGAAGLALAAAVAGSRSLQLAVHVDDPALADLPWETLVLPGQDTPLVLQPGVQLHRTVDVPDPVAVSVRGPLRILAVIASPEHGGGELLDYEAELARILAAVDPSRRRDGAYVRVLNWGTPDAIRAALAAERFHVLHISCHAQPGALVLESDTGAAELVTAQRMVEEILVREHGVPLVVLAGCSTALAAGDGEQALPGLARDLLRAGIPAVLAMTAPVTDRYATALGADLYRNLAAVPEPVPVTELAGTRRRLEDQRRALPPNDPRGAWAEWATPALFQSGPPFALYRRSDGSEPVAGRVETRAQLGGMIRQVGDFVGRRAELRTILRGLRDGAKARRRARCCTASAGSGRAASPRRSSTSSARTPAWSSRSAAARR